MKYIYIYIYIYHDILYKMQKSPIFLYTRFPLNMGLNLLKENKWPKAKTFLPFIE